MRKFVLHTHSESGDNYTYFIKHKTEPTHKELEKFLEVNACDKDDEMVYEHVRSINEILDKDFISIPNN